MTTIGAGWKKQDKNGNPYISFAVDKALLPLTLDSTKLISAYPVKEKQTDKSPDFRLDIFIPSDEKETKKDDSLL